MEPSSRTEWLPRDPSKRWAERFVLWYSPVWIGLVALVQLWPGGTAVPLSMHDWGDVGFMSFGALLAAPLVLWPWLRPGEADRSRPASQRHILKLNLWILVFTWSGSYFISHYFFRVMGMRYGFNATWTLDATIGQPSGGSVPFFLYLMTQAYFATYHVVMTVLYRGLRTRFRLGPASQIALVGAFSYGVAYAETWAMANPLLERYFTYADRDWMLSVGSSAYALLFVVSLPLYSRIDERRDGSPEPTRWPLRRVLLEAMAASWLSMQLVDVWAKLVG